MIKKDFIQSGTKFLTHVQSLFRKLIHQFPAHQSVFNKRSTITKNQQFMQNLSFNTSTGAITQYGIGQSPGGTFVDADGVFWIVSLFTTLGTNVLGDNNSFYPTSGALAWFNTTTNQWVPVVTNGTFNCISGTGTAGEYWLGGSFNSIDNSALTGLSGLVRFTKNNAITINTTALVNNGLTNRTSFKLYYKGQSIMLVNPDNSTWMMSNNTYLGANAPSVLLY